MKAIRFLLFPFALVYDLTTSIRNVFYDGKVFSSTEFSVPVIAVGNLSVGGTGKTPQIEYLIRLLQDQKKVAVLSRGYKRKTKGFILIENHHGVDDVGDEPLQFFKKFPKISVAVDAERVQGIQQLQKKVNPDVILLDDAFQHRKVKAGYYILLTKYHDLYTNDFLLPTGNLRESKRGAKRANSIVVTKCPESLSAIEKQQIQKRINPNSNQSLFFSSISYHKKTKGFNEIMVSELSEYQIVLVTGIANPSPLVEFLQKSTFEIHHINFPDHHKFTMQEIKNIQHAYENITSDKKVLLTTEKDYMRLLNKIPELSYLEIESMFLERHEDFDQLILNEIST